LGTAMGRMTFTKVASVNTGCKDSGFNN